MLGDLQRFDRYMAQTGRLTLTARQRRRMLHKAGHQSELALGRRAFRSVARQEARERNALLPKTSR